MLLVPTKLVLAWGIAVAVHELSHYLALKFFCVDVNGICISAAGIQMNIGEMSVVQELVCALAGPMGGLCLLLFSKWLPCTAVCGFVQSVFNLLPIYPLDGGRALLCMFRKLFGNSLGEKVSKAMGIICIVIIFVLAGCLFVRFDMGAVSLIVCGVFLFKFKLANKGNK